MSDEHKQLIWRLLQPAIVAMIVALLVSMGVEMTKPPDDVEILPAGISHFSSVYSNDDVEAVDDLIAGDDVTVTDDITCDDLTAGVLSVESVSASNNLTVTGSLGLTGAFAGSSTGSFASLLTASNGVNVTNNITATGTITGQAELQVGTFVNLAECTATTVTDGAVFTPTHTYTPITAAGEVTPTVETTGYTSGDLLVLTNEGTNTINLADSGTMMLTAAWAAGQYDTLWLMFDGTNWLEISRANN
jgi:hypothetical protein